MPPKRPFGVTLLLWMVLCLSAWGAVRFVAALRWWDALYEFESRLGPLYLSISGAGWVVAGGVLLWSMWNGKKWAHPAIPIFITLWLAEYWIERLFFQSSRANLPFALTMSVLLLGVTLVSAFNRRTISFFTRSEEHEQQDQHPPSA